jgi:hypothetical protein
MWPEIVTKIINSNNISEDIKNNILLQFLLKTKETFLHNLNDNNIFANHIQKTLCMYEIKDEDVDQIINAMNTMEIKIERIDFRWINLKLWGCIYAQDMYVLNLDNISKILEHEYKIPQSEDFSHKTLSLIFSQASEPLVKYVDNQLPSLLPAILDSCNNIITDDETTAIAVLNNESILIEEKRQYSAFLKPCIKTIKSVKNIELWSLVVVSNLQTIDPTNILAYFFLSGNGLDQFLIKSINESAEIFNLSYKEINKLYPNKASVFFKAIIQCNTLTDLKYTKILIAIRYSYPTFLIEGLSENKLNALILNKIIICDKETLDNIRVNYSRNLSLFIENNIDDYYNIIQTTGVVDSELELIQSMNSLNYKKRLSLLKLTTSQFQTIGKNYPESIEAHIVVNNFNDNELEYFINNFSSLKNKTKLAFFSILPKKIGEVLSQEFPIQFELLMLIFEDENYDKTIKKELYSNSISVLSYQQNLICLKSLKEQDFINIFYNKKPYFINNGYNEKVLQSYMNRGWIKRITKQNDGCLKANGCKREYIIK